MSYKMSQYANWVKANMYNSKSYYQFWKDDYTFVRGVYDKHTNKGMEQVYLLSDEYEIDKTDENYEDLSLYQE
ncbi:MAG TPA: hypothetical protein VFC79_08595 [Tissierellaceae bacterium]|nr:hypothetical protein [Tissierellaceae bacterium]